MICLNAVFQIYFLNSVTFYVVEFNFLPCSWREAVDELTEIAEQSPHVLLCANCISHQSARKPCSTPNAYRGLRDCVVRSSKMHSSVLWLLLICLRDALFSIFVDTDQFLRTWIRLWWHAKVSLISEQELVVGCRAAALRYRSAVINSDIGNDITIIKTHSFILRQRLLRVSWRLEGYRTILDQLGYLMLP
jgi:hypothetical protein